MPESTTCMVGKKIFLRPVKEEDVYGRWWQWLNDPEVTRYLNKGHEENTVEKQLCFFRKINNDKNAVFAICDISTNAHIGTTGIHDMTFIENKKIGYFGILLGEKGYWRKGIGREAWTMVINYAFESLQLDLIETKIFYENLVSRHIAQELGFQSVRILKREFIKNSQAIDRLLLRLDKARWAKIMKDE